MVAGTSPARLRSATTKGLNMRLLAGLRVLPAVVVPGLGLSIEGGSRREYRDEFRPRGDGCRTITVERDRRNLSREEAAQWSAATKPRPVFAAARCSSPTSRPGDHCRPTRSTASPFNCRDFAKIVEEFGGTGCRAPASGSTTYTSKSRSALRRAGSLSRPDSRQTRRGACRRTRYRLHQSGPRRRLASSPTSLARATQHPLNPARRASRRISNSLQAKREACEAITSQPKSNGWGHSTHTMMEASREAPWSARAWRGALRGGMRRIDQLRVGELHGPIPSGCDGTLAVTTATPASGSSRPAGELPDAVTSVLPGG